MLKEKYFCIYNSNLVKKKLLMVVETIPLYNDDFRNIISKLDVWRKKCDYRCKDIYYYKQYIIMIYNAENVMTNKHDFILN